MGGSFSVVADLSDRGDHARHALGGRFVTVFARHQQ